MATLTANGHADLVEPDLTGPWLQVLRLVRADLKAAATTLTDAEARYMVDCYYQLQDYRKRADNQRRAGADAGEPHKAVLFVQDGLRWIEESIKAALDRYTATEPTGMGAWAREIVGIGPVISAGLLAHKAFDPRFRTVGHTWSFFGLDPTKRWNAGAKRPWNADAKVLCWKAGESFVKVSGNPRDIYGKVYLRRKEYEQKKNEAGDYRDQAGAKLKFKIGKDTEAYKYLSVGKLPPGHIHARAKRYAVKLFLAHYWAEAYRRHFGEEPPLPYPIAILGHAHLIDGPGAIRP